MRQTLDWTFPLPRTHTGIVQGNGTLGLMIWGEGRTLRLTLGRADLWDHRGGMPWTERMSYAGIRACLEHHDEPGLRALFEKTAEKEGEPPRPSIIPVGRLELDLGSGAELAVGRLDLRDGSVAVRFRRGGRTHELRILMDMDEPRLALALPAGLARPRIRAVPAWESLGPQLEKISFPPPEPIVGKALAGWYQAMPADPGVCVGYRRSGRALLVAAPRGADLAAGRTEAVRLLDAAEPAALARRARRWWSGYWKTVPAVRIPNERLDFLYTYGMYKFATFTRPAGVPATLQGPWIEDYQMPPWSSDYHFNINVQMCYQPAYHGNRLENLRPLFDMIFSWEEQLRHNARVFLGIEDGVMLPHAVDDRCTCMGGFWTGSVDHGCTAWVALMMYRYYRYTMDRAFLPRAYRFMAAAMRVYEGMLERDGERLALPVSVSPEYRGAEMNAWGRNASFQLACIHALAEALAAAARELGEPPRPAWTDISERLPRASLAGPAGAEMIGLWDGLVLEESHRHHSHLAAIAPFEVVSIDDPAWRDIITRSLTHWIYRGPGLWSGWCIPWASAIHSRVGNAEAAELYLEVFDKVYTNEGFGTLHDAAVPGFTLMGISAVGRKLHRPEIMQMDGGMGAVAAVQEMLLHTRRGVTHLFPGAPARWRRVSFSGMRTEGAFLVGAARTDGAVESVQIRSLAGGVLRLANPWPGAAAAVRARGRERLEGRELAIRTKPGETLELRPAARRGA